MTALVPWLLGKHVTAVTVTPQTVAADGTLSAVTANAASLVGFLDEIAIQLENTTEMIQSMDRRLENDVIVGSRATVTMTEILKANDSSGTPTNLLAFMAMNYDYVFIAFTRGGRSWGGYFVLRSYGETLVRGKSVGRLEISIVDPNAVGGNPQYS